MDSTRSAGTFEHVAKMSRLTNPSPAGPTMPPVRFRPSIMPYGDLSSMPPLQHSRVPNDTETATTTTSESEANNPPVKIRSNVIGSRPRKSSLTSSESWLDQADREKIRNKQRQRELQKQQENGTEPIRPEYRDDRESRKKDKHKKDRKERKESEEPFNIHQSQDDRKSSTARKSSSDPKEKARRKLSKAASDSSHDVSRPGRNMRAAPRRSSSARSSETPDTVLSRRQQIGPGMYEELMQQLASQQALHDEQVQLRQTAQHLINEAYQQQRENSRVKQELDSNQAKALLDEAFPLTSKKHPGYTAPTSPPSVSNGSTPSADFQRVRKSTADGKKYKQPKTALEKLLAGGSLTGLPPKHSRKPSNSSLSDAAASRTQPREEDPQGTSPRPSVASNDSHNVRSAAEVISRGLDNLSPREKNILLQAIRTELQAMQPPSTGD